MQIEKFTDKSKRFIQHAQSLATRNGHQSMEPEHLLKVMIEDETGAVQKLVSAAGGDVVKLKSATEKSLAKLPVVEGGSGLRISNDLSKILDNAVNLAEKSGDKFVTAERILQAMVMAKKMDVAGHFEEAGLNDNALNGAINDMRKGRTADSETADDNFDALNKYAHDLTQAARDGKVDPIIGRDEEIRRTVQVLSCLLYTSDAADE